jgi:outer membrane protein OmpA-like peptidoglycan-associated protein
MNLSKLLAVGVLPGLLAFSPLLASEEPKDAPYLSGMPNYALTGGWEDKEFDAFPFFTGKGAVTVEGKFWVREYLVKEGAKEASELQILRNYSNAIRNMGGEVFFEGPCRKEECGDKYDLQLVSGKISKGGKEIWVEVVAQNSGTDYMLRILEKEQMKQDVTASDMLDALNKDGRVALYINFDTGKSTIKPESAKIVDQIVQMMKKAPELKISVEGHTDSVGTPEKNKILSQERAKAVVDAITREGIDAQRLRSAGFGQDKPVADNSTDEGKAKNRRVELVKR